MRRASFVITAAVVVLLVGGAVGVYAYDSAREKTIAEGVTVGGVDVGGMPAGKARKLLKQEIKQPLERTVHVRAGGKRYELTPDAARVRIDLTGMVRDALAESRDGSVLTRTFRDLTGDTLDADIPSRITYSTKAVRDFVAEIDEKVSREAKNAEVIASGSGLSTVAGEKGVAMLDEKLTRRLTARLETPVDDRTLRAETKKVAPEVTKAELVDKYPYYITVDRSSFQLRFYKNLELVKSYTVAVGQVGYDTPAGLYHIQNKAVDPAWSVPNSDWAGRLAGQVIPGGAPNNPLKERWLGIYDGAGIHGTDDVGSLGSAASHGCIRMSIPEVVELYDQVPVQTPIYIE